ncbi:inositol monophosphatase [Gammaproteobacteria bacterium]|nr:inositol monophosphatase [Gammaproteobacteria bacterium]
MELLNLDGELKTAIDAATAAGKLLYKNKKDLNKLIFSSDTDIKLKADIEAEDLIISILTKESSFPILAEESGKSEAALEETFWVVDPLDGTANYSRNIPLCCVSIALMYKMHPVIGVVYDFNNNDLYEGSLDKEAKLNGSVIKVSDVNKSKKAILVTGLPNNTDYTDSALLKMVKDFQEWRKVRMIGSAAIASCYIASAKADVYKEFGTYLWDVAAGAAIVNAAGGKAEITNYRDNYQVDVHFSNSKIID